MAHDVDVIVAGAGAAGLTAALAAAEGGRRVALLEAKENFREDCNTVLSTSMIPAGGSRWQTELGIEDSPEVFRDDVLRKTKGEAEGPVLDALTEVAPELVGWLADAWGVPLDLATDFRYPGHSAPRCHSVPERSGKPLHDHLVVAATGHDGIDLAVPMRLEHVHTEEGTVVGATVVTPDGREERLSTPVVVLATNGFGASPDFVKNHLPEMADALYFGGNGSTGDALVIGAELGADTAFLDSFQGHGSVAVPQSVMVTWTTIMHGAIIVNQRGERFSDETTGYSEWAAITLAQPDGIAWHIMDRRVYDLCTPFADFQTLIESRAIRTAPDAEALASIVGAPSEAIETTLTEARRAATGASLDPHGRTDWEAPLEPPYLATRITGALFHTQGGLAVDGNARVLSGGQPILGLYAAGGAASGISGHGAGGYLAGNGLLSAFGLGYIAGRHVVGETYREDVADLTG